jgi:hypothetical protein
MIGGGRSTLWGVEAVMTGAITLMLVPLWSLYLLDLSGGTISPDAEWALAGAVGLAGIWLALLRNDSFYKAHPMLRWIVVATLIVAVATLAYLAWGSARIGGWYWGVLVMIAPIGIALHQAVRLLRL